MHTADRTSVVHTKTIYTVWRMRPTRFQFNLKCNLYLLTCKLYPAHALQGRHYEGAAGAPERLVSVALPLAMNGDVLNFNGRERGSEQLE